MKKHIDASRLTDEELVEHITEVDPEMFIHIVERYQAPLIRYARTYVHELESAEDVVQNSFIKAYQNLRSFKLDKKFSSWMYRITHNEAINHIKKHKREFRPENEDWFESVIDDRPTPLDDAEATMLREMTGSILAQLDRKYREPVTLYFIEGKTYQEISEILRLPSVTVGTRIRRAKKQLEDILTQKGITL